MTTIIKSRYCLLLLLVGGLFSCKKEDTSDGLSKVLFNKQGVIRLECNQCEINYQVYDKQFNTVVKNGNSDIPFFYTSDLNLKTEVVSAEQQNIRLMVLDSYGRVISNELSAFEKGESREKVYLISTR